MTLVHILEGALLGVLLEHFRVRLALKKLKEVQADIVVRALSNSVMIDGVELPQPSDERWKMEARNIKINGRDTQAYLCELGAVCIDENDVWSGGGMNMPRTKATKKYCTDVWKAYRSRIARKAIETT